MGGGGGGGGADVLLARGALERVLIEDVGDGGKAGVPRVRDGDVGLNLQRLAAGVDKVDCALEGLGAAARGSGEGRHFLRAVLADDAGGEGGGDVEGEAGAGGVVLEGEVRIGLVGVDMVSFGGGDAALAVGGGGRGGGHAGDVEEEGEGGEGARLS